MKKSMMILKRLLVYLILTVISFLILFPIVYMVADSMMSRGEIMEYYGVMAGTEGQNPQGMIKSIGFHLIPEKVSFMQYYQVLLRRPRFLLLFLNSVFVTLPIVSGQMMVSALAAYAFSKLRFPLREPLFFIYILVMMLPFQVTLVPNYIILKDLNLLGTYWAIILPGVFTTFGVFLLRQFMILIPDEYCEAAKIDGAGYLMTFSRIILPQCKSAMASLAILVFVDNWNMVEQPLIFLRDELKYPLSVFLSRINSGDLGLAFSCGVLYMVPVLLIFLYGENYLVEGIQLSGIK